MSATLDDAPSQTPLIGRSPLSPLANLPFHLLLILAVLLIAAHSASAQSVTWIHSTTSAPWQTSPATLGPANPDVPADVRVAKNKTYQTIDGFGGCFNELGWAALAKLPDADRERAIQALFSEDGCAFTLARIPIGASDFALDAYSLADTPGDLELKHFSIARDQKHLIPYIRAAMQVRPTLQCWASPWSPPAWMKTNDNYSKGSLKWEPAILRSYAHYFARWVEAYRGEGINIYAIAPQNEPNIASPYPTCLWTGPQLGEFIADYLGPTLRERNANVELWLGLNGDPPEHGNNPNARLLSVLSDPKASSFLTGIAFQYDSRTQIGLAYELFPDKKLMQSETECFAGNNNWADAQRLFGHIKRYLDNGASSYFMWNMVLNETGMSTWKWKQNAMITAHEKEQKLVLNPEYHVMRHFSQFVKPGAKRILTTGVWGDRIAFLNADGSMVLVMGNTQNRALPVNIAFPGIGGQDTLTVTLPPASFSTFVVR